MIFDSIENIGQYRGLSALLDLAIDFLEENELHKMDDGTLQIKGDDVYVMIQRYETEGSSGRSFETHENYIDLQYVASGSETIAFCERKHLTENQPYDAESDVTLYGYDESQSHTHLNFREGDFAVFFPTDAHVPKLHGPEGPSRVVKAVFKVKVAPDR